MLYHNKFKLSKIIREFVYTFCSVMVIRLLLFRSRGGIDHFVLFLLFVEVDVPDGFVFYLLWQKPFTLDLCTHFISFNPVSSFQIKQYCRNMRTNLSKASLTITVSTRHSTCQIKYMIQHAKGVSFKR